jgi:hypothetical protein
LNKMSLSQLKLCCKRFMYEEKTKYQVIFRQGSFLRSCLSCPLAPVALCYCISFYFLASWQASSLISCSIVFSGDQGDKFYLIMQGVVSLWFVLFLLFLPLLAFPLHPIPPFFPVPPSFPLLLQV